MNKKYIEWLNSISKSDKIDISTVISIILGTGEINKNRILPYKIPWSRFEQKTLERTQVKEIIKYIINKECENIVIIKDYLLASELKKYLNKENLQRDLVTSGPLSTIYGINNIDDLDNFLIVKINNHDNLQKILGITNIMNPHGKTAVYVSKTKGIFIDLPKTRPYPIKNNRSKIFHYLLQNNGIPKSLKEISDNFYDGHEDRFQKEYRHINQIFKKKLQVNYDHIIHIPTGGYSINNDDYTYIIMDD